MKKYLPGISVLILLFVFPAVAYFYLKEGFDFRYDALQELEAKGAFDHSTVTCDLKPEDFKAAESTAYPPTCLYHFTDVASFNRRIDTLDQLFELFKNRTDFHFAHVFESEEKIPADLTYDSEQRILCSAKDSKSFSSSDFILVDYKGKVRQHYSFEPASFSRMIEHIPIVLPHEKSKKVELIRNQEK